MKDKPKSGDAADLEIFVSERIAKLRQAKDVSAREMSLSISQNVNYINHIENRKMEPSLSGLLYICNYFGITLQEFFDEGNPYPARLKDFIEDVKRIDDESLTHLAGIVRKMLGKKR